MVDAVLVGLSFEVSLSRSFSIDPQSGIGKMRRRDKVERQIDQRKRDKAISPRPSR
uniref:Uncharacterized protein n=1 Tax=Cucumis melo TaxID=3656 RepID=A0A9I9DTX7_CUCME